MTNLSDRERICKSKLLEFPLLAKFIEQPEIDSFNQRIEQVISGLDAHAKSCIHDDPSRIDVALDGISVAVKILQELIDLRHFVTTASELANKKE